MKIVSRRWLLIGLIIPAIVFGEGTVSLPKLSDDAKITGPLSAFGAVSTSALHPQFQGSFEYTVDNTDLNTNTVTNGATVTQASGMGVLTTSTTTESDAQYESKRHARYKAGMGGLIRFTALFTPCVAGTEQYIGIADEVGSSAAFKNGYMIGCDGATFGFHRFQNDVKFSINQTDWDDKLNGFGVSGLDLDITKLNVVFIQYQYLGAGAIKLFIESNLTGMPVLTNNETYTNQNIVPSTFNPNYHFQIWVDNKATTSNLILKTSSYAYFVEGKTSFVELHQPQNSSGLQETTSITTELAIFTIRNRTSYASKTNFIDIMLEQFVGSVEASAANNLSEIRLVRDATIGGTPSFSDISTSNSVIEIDTAGTTVTGGKEIFTIPLAGKNDKDVQNILNYNIVLGPGEAITAAGTSVNSATMRASLLWKELF